jgi:putative transposase
VNSAYGLVVPRKPRIEVPGGFFHICTRGNAQKRLFLDTHDYEAWLEMLARTVEGFAWLCHAYCVMPNHFHLLLETPEPTRGTGMRHLNGSYAQRFNARYDGSGHVFQGPYSATPIVDESHFLEVCRYIVLNPVRAGLCEDPRQWRWSSYRATAGIVRAPAFLMLDTVLGLFGKGEVAHREYQQFVDDGHPRSTGHVQGPGPEPELRHASRS